MATDPISYDKADLRGIVKAFKAMDEQAVQQAKGVSNGLATYLQSKITQRHQAGQIALHAELLKDRGSASHQKLVKSALALCLKNFQRWRYNSTALGRLRIRIK
jgi:hypothetical protein